MARSDNWRINKSGIMAVEGAQVLKSLQKVAGAAGLPKDFKIRFATKSRGSGISFDDKEVVIGAGRLFNEAPIPSDLFDVLVGLTLHEVGHERIDTAGVQKLMQREFAGGRRTAPRKFTKPMSMQEADLFQKFINIGEDIVIESRTRANKNLAEYDEALHKWATAQMREAQPSKLLEVWIEYALGHKSTTVMNLPDELNDSMQRLVALTGWLRGRDNDGSWRASSRFDSYLKYWDIVKGDILEPPKPDPQPDTQSQDQTALESGTDSKQGDSGDNEPDTPEKSEKEPSSDSGVERETSPVPDDTSGDGTNDGSAPDPDDDSSQTSDGSKDGDTDEMDRPLAPNDKDTIDDELAEAIDSAIESELEDVTEQVAEEMGEQQQDGKYHRTLPVIRSRETKTPLIKPDSLLRKRLERIMTIRKRLQARTMRGEQYGRIDKRHLHRIGTDERIFSLRYKFPDGFPNTRILIDLSASMSGKEASEVLQAAGALQTLVNAEVWCYNGMQQVNLVRMDDGKLIHQFRPDGNTPSGLAIVGVSLGMQKGGLVVHLTDGEHNVGQTPWTAHWILKKKGIELVNLIWGKDTGNYALGGMNYRRLDGLAEFPEALYGILVEQVKLQKIGGK